jgi:hypothetical protein
MAHRDYGLGETKPPPTVGGPLPSDAWSGRAIIAGVAVVLIVLVRNARYRCDAVSASDDGGLLGATSVN